jgi:serine/threonine-protein kinase
LLHEIGAGAMGEVWAAEHIALGRRAAVKLLKPCHVGNEHVEGRFLAEARATAAARHPSTVEIFDFGYHHDGRPFIAMELLEGWTVGDQIKQHGPLDCGTTLSVARQVAAALASAHAAGIVHRDLKPDNIFLLAGAGHMFAPTVKLLDFGVAKLLGDSSGRTRTGMVLGSPLYMSPEQCRGARGVDSRTDFYSLGCVMFAMLTGRPPFPGTSLPAVLAGHMFEDVPRLSDERADIPPEIDALVAVLMRKEPEGRYQRAIELVEAIDRFGPNRFAA